MVSGALLVPPFILFGSGGPVRRPERGQPTPTAAAAA